VPERGCVLLASPSLFHTRQTHFRCSAIFIFEHDGEGSSGVILDALTQANVRLADVPGAAAAFPELAESRVWKGGDVGSGHLNVLHPAGLGGTEIVDGVAMGAFDAVRRATQSEKLPPASARFFAQQCGWGPGQLEMEVGDGAWMLASCSADLILSQPSCSTPAAPDGTHWQGGLWARVLRLMGDRWAEVANKTLAEG
jgi:putative transcriptional regulator